MRESVVHPFAPVFDAESRILILGSFPSVRSRAVGFYYEHPQNRFWRVMETLFGENIPESTGAKRAFLLAHHIALWDVAAQCEILGSSDGSIRSVVPNDIDVILQNSSITGIYTNGKTAHAMYQKYQLPTVGRQDICLPSTSPANAAWSLPRLCESWRVILGEENGERI